MAGVFLPTEEDAKNISRILKKLLIFESEYDIIASVIRRYDGIGRRAGLKIQW